MIQCDFVHLFLVLDIQHCWNGLQIRAIDENQHHTKNIRNEGAS